MRNSIAILAIASLATTAFGQYRHKDTLRFTAERSYSRALLRSEKGQLAIATSKTGVIVLDEKKQTNQTPVQPSTSGEFRDILVTPKGLVSMVSGDNGELLLHSDTLLFKKGMFFDAIDGHQNSVVVLADPIDGSFPLFLVNVATKETVSVKGPAPIGDEACYAASGTTVAWLSDSTIAFISGGSQAARFHRTDDLGKTWHSVDLPLQQGEGCGPFSVHFLSQKNAVVVGGCYTDPTNPEKTAAYSTDGGTTWIASAKNPGGYRSCVTGTSKQLFACGSNGIDISTDGGKTWQPFDTGNYCALLLEKKQLYATTNTGVCIRYTLK